MPTTLSIVIPCYDDYDGVAFTLMSLLAHHPVDDCQIVVSDSNPDSAHGLATSQLCSWHPDRVTYVPQRGIRGTADAKARAIALATGDWFLCVDCHVLLMPAAIDALRAHIEADPMSPDLVHGPLVGDGLKPIATHFDDRWSGDMWGTWAISPEVLEGTGATEIPASGMGLFASRRDAFVGFHPSMRGFGGEEWIVHEATRRRGARAVCLPGLYWWHRFNRPAGVPYAVSTRDKLRNYLVGLTDLGIDVAACRDEFSANHGGAFFASVAVDSGFAHLADPAEVDRILAADPAWSATIALAASLGPAVSGDPIAARLLPPVPEGFSATVEVIDSSGDGLYERLAASAAEVVVLRNANSHAEFSKTSGPGVRAMARRFLRERAEWTLLVHDHTGDGHLVLSRRPADKRALPGRGRMLLNFASAIASHVADGAAKIGLPVYEERLDECAMCPSRTDDRCGECGCFIAEKAKWRSSECPVGRW